MNNVLSTCNAIILPNEIKFVSTNIVTTLTQINFTISNELNFKTKLIYKGFKITESGELQIAFMNLSNKIEDYKIRNGQLLGVIHGKETP